MIDPLPFFPSFLNPGTLILGLSTSNTLSFTLGQFSSYHNPLLRRSENGTSCLPFIKEVHGSSSTFSVSIYEVYMGSINSVLLPSCTEELNSVQPSSVLSTHLYTPLYRLQLLLCV